MVADVHRTIFKGGIFLYPSDSRYTKGKLRLLYECIPFAFILERVGGKCYSDEMRILDCLPVSIHERCPVFLGSPQNIDKLLTFIN